MIVNRDFMASPVSDRRQNRENNANESPSRQVSSSTTHRAGVIVERRAKNRLFEQKCEQRLARASVLPVICYQSIGTKDGKMRVTLANNSLSFLTTTHIKRVMRLRIESSPCPVSLQLNCSRRFSLAFIAFPRRYILRE